MAKILLADDNVHLNQALTKALKDHGHDVTSTNNGADLLCLLKVNTPCDLIILDLMMPGLNGHDVIKSLGPATPPVIVITGHDLLKTDVDTGKVFRVLVKPFELEQLLKVLNEALVHNERKTSQEIGRAGE